MKILSDLELKKIYNELLLIDDIDVPGWPVSHHDKNVARLARNAIKELVTRRRIDNDFISKVNEITSKQKVSALNEHDPVLEGIDRYIKEYGYDVGGGEGHFYVDDKVLSLKQLRDALVHNTPEGQSFRNDIYDTIIIYFSKFGNKSDGDADE